MPEQDATLADVLGQYAPGTGKDRYVRFIDEVLDYPVTDTLEAMAKSLEQNEQTLAVGANGPGKSYAAALLAVTVLYTNADVVVPVTAGNGDTLKNSIWKPIKSIWRNTGLPGDYKDNDRSLHTQFDDEWFLECHSPKYADDLEGDHNDNVVYLIEEADKPGVTAEHIDSARSTLGDDDHILVIANPPTDETNVVADLMNNPEWHRLQFPTWESRNARVDRGICDKDKIGGIAGLSKMQSDWAEYHDSSWPGIERVIEVSSPYLTPSGEPTTREWEAARETKPNAVVGREGLYDANIRAKENPEFRSDLHIKWYKRRAGVMPPDSAEKWRPWSIADVEAGYNRDVGYVRETPECLGVDVADKVDTTKAIGLHDQKAIVEYKSQDPLPEQQRELTAKIREWPEMDGHVDAIGKGAQLAQTLQERFQGFSEFAANEVAVDEQYRYKWCHGLQLIGEWLRSGGSFEDKRLYEQLKIGARVLEFERRHLSSRGKVIEATPKDKLKKELGYSPDELDALLMCIMARETDATDGKAAPTFGW
ncbi:terminase large subunit [Haloarcula tailed virus 3]|uniref:Terminase large subunit n=1 Tax=Haloarcula tailed virus 3 TaxID=2877990 RepID=A0AAE9BZD1_9CAUD|nr:terminase large subunit [Haloarcula tailed virus 3]UBF23358.1 terminase large subunit [Haloarcula tailed virus 3]